MDSNFAAIVTAARAHSGMTAAEFDYNLATRNPDQKALNALNQAANRHLPEVNAGDGPEVLSQRRRNAEELTARYRDDITALIGTAQAASYTGWSAAAHGPIRHAR